MGINKDLFNRKFNLLDVEKNLLSLILTRRGVIDDVSKLLQKEDFENGSDSIHKTIYGLALKCFERYKYVSIPAIIDEIKNSGVIRLTSVANMDISQYIESLGVMIIRDDNHKGLANILKEASVRRKIFIATSEIQYNLLNAKFDNPNASVATAEKIFAECVSKVDRGSDRPINIYENLSEALDETKNQDYSTNGYPCPYPTIQKIYGSLNRPGNITLFTSRSGVGKALADYERVRMADGSLRKISALRVGEYVVSADGEPAQVMGIYPQGRKKVCKFHWGDGRASTVASLDHLWEVYSFLGTKRRVEVLTSQQIIARLRGGEKLFVPSGYWNGSKHEKLKSVTYKNLGKYLRDGKVTDDVFDNLKKNFGEFEGLLENRDITKMDFSYSTIVQRLAFIKEYLTNNPVIWKTGEYQFQSANSARYDNSPQHRVRFQTEDVEFANKIVELFHSVGGSGSVKYDKLKKVYKVLCGSAKLFRTNKDGFRTNDYVRIYDVTVSDMCMCTCIKVDNPSHLFLLENNILTHNTQITMDIATKISEAYKVPVLHFDNGEMSERELQYRRLSSMSGVGFYEIESGKWANNPQSVTRLRRAIKMAEGKELFYYQAAGKSFDEMRDMVKSFYDNVCKGGQMIFVFDYMKPPQNGSFKEQEYQYIGRLMDKFKALIHDEILVDRKPVISMLTSVQSNKLGVVGKKTSEEMEDSETVYGMSDRLIHYASHCAILRGNTRDECKLQGEEFGTHKLIFTKARHLGEDVGGHLNLVEMPDGSLRRNSINLDFKNFSVTDKGDLRDVVRSLCARNINVKVDNESDTPF